MIFGKHINKYYLRYMPVLLLGVFTLLVIDYYQLKIPELYNLVINGMNNGVVDINGVQTVFDANVLLDHICKPLIIVITIMVIGRFLWRICFFGTARRVETHVRSKMYAHCSKLSQEYYQVNKVGNLMSLFTNDLETIQECFGHGILTFSDALLLGSMAIIKMWHMDPMLTLLSLIPMACLLVVGTIVGKSMTLKWDERQAAFSSLSDFSQESFSGIAVVKAFVKEFKELIAFRWLSKKNENANIEYTKASTLLNIFVTLFVESVICIILGYGSWLVKKDVFNGGELLEFIGYFNSIIWPVMAISELIDLTSRGKASLKRITKLLDAKIDVYDKDVEEVEKLNSSIEFKNLTFRYPGADYDSLIDVSFKVNAGESVGIVGKTGCGKTTLVDLILRTYNVPDGTLFIDGHDVNRIPIRTVRQHAAYVPQDNFLFSDTIKNNIAFATVNVNESPDDEAVKNSAILSDVHSNIMEFSANYDTILGERGVTVSGGQKQRISIARALMKNAPILILDDSVSAVDTDTEKKILKNLSENRQGLTTLLIAHRISTVENMDKIVFMDDGRLVAFGTHEELLATCEDYQKLVRLQKLDEEWGGN